MSRPKLCGECGTRPSGYRGGGLGAGRCRRLVIDREHDLCGQCYRARAASRFATTRLPPSPASHADEPEEAA